MTILAHKIALDPNSEQLVYFARAAGVARFAWNWALAEWQRQYRLGQKPSEGALRKLLNAIKGEQFPWMAEVTKTAPQQAIKNIGTAFQNFFAGRAKYPRFKKKGVSLDSFRADNGTSKRYPNAVDVDGRRVKLPVIGWVRMREALRFAGKVMSATVSRTADRWFVSLAVETDHIPPVRETQVAGGVDLGVRAMATLSDGGTIEGPKALRKNLKKLRRHSRALSRKVKGSANRRKAAGKLARLHARIANIRKDALHKATTAIVRRFDVIGMETLNVRGMMANGRLARAIADVGMAEFARQIAYKAAMAGVRLVLADRWFPSSKRCSDCGHVHAALALGDREWTCGACGMAHDRDRNAAINLMMAASSAVAACGADGSGPDRKIEVKPAAMKQELTHGRLLRA